MTKTALTRDEIREIEHRMKCDRAAVEIWKFLDAAVHKSRAELGPEWGENAIWSIREIITKSGV